jgi:hypothetical protein
MLYNLVLHIADYFFDDVKVIGPKTKYNNQKVAFSVCRFILEHLKKVNAILLAFELIRAIVSAAKLE